MKNAAIIRVLFAFAAAAAAAVLPACRDMGKEEEYRRERSGLCATVAEIQELQLGLLIVKVQPEFIHYVEIPRVLESGSVQYLHERNEMLIEFMEWDAWETSSEIARIERIIELKRELDRVKAADWRRK